MHWNVVSVLILPADNTPVDESIKSHCVVLAYLSILSRHTPDFPWMKLWCPFSCNQFRAWLSDDKECLWSAYCDWRWGKVKNWPCSFLWCHTVLSLHSQIHNTHILICTCTYVHTLFLTPVDGEVLFAQSADKFFISFSFSFFSPLFPFYISLLI